MAVVSCLVCSSSDIIGDLLIAPISNLRSAQLLHVASPVTGSAVALGAEIPPSLPLKLFHKGRQRVLLVQALLPHRYFVLQSLQLSASSITSGLWQEQTLRGHAEGHAGAKELDLPLTSAMQMLLARYVMESGACFSCCCCDQHEQNIR